MADRDKDLKKDGDGYKNERRHIEEKFWQHCSSLCS